MGEVSALATAALTVTFVWLISWIVNKLESLPVDFGVAGLSLILLFVDLADREMHESERYVGHNAVWLTTLVLGLYAFTLALGTSVFLSSKAKPPAALAEYKISNTLFREFGYWFSLTISFFMLLLAVSAASSVGTLMSIDLQARGGLATFYSQLTSQFGMFMAVLLAVFLALTALVRALSTKPKKNTSKKSAGGVP